MNGFEDSQPQNPPRVGYADEFRLVTSGGRDSFSITVTGNNNDSSTPWGTKNNEQRGYLSIARQSSNGSVVTTIDRTVKVNLPGQRVFTIPENSYEEGDTFRIKIAGFDVDEDNNLGSIAPDARLGYKIEIENKNANPTTKFELQERVFVLNDNGGGTGGGGTGGGGTGGGGTGGGGTGGTGGGDIVGSTQNTTFTSTNNPLALESGTVQLAYVGYYGRPADPAGRNFWNQVLRDNNIFYSPRGGVTLNSLSETQRALYQEFIDDFGNSSESDRLFGALTIDSRINLVYRNAFNRDVDTAGLSFWRNAINQEDVSLPAIALEIVLGARDTDTIRVRNKITSADLFTDALFGGLENRYIGSNAETIGRNFLANIDTSVATTNQVSAGVNSLPILV
ncbi:DUF4214 domain-containing protein [Cyanobacterium sp. IPPAS B-1200]|uniref:DUF4214 domain-containing protein n=1 Tax=Cyanobacterium sp. IPPAS B-1200 TaxID=1562720 RepID=UPI00114D258C|nr:DUF4214 domain-containing protein [Cyanobacterium sp. IPPAS B-1200]